MQRDEGLPRRLVVLHHGLTMDGERQRALHVVPADALRLDAGCREHLFPHAPLVDGGDDHGWVDVAARLLQRLEHYGAANPQHAVE